MTTPRRSCSTASRTGCPSSTATTSVGARHVAAPGCYPTTASLALAPLLAAGLVERGGIVVDAASGVSGAGRGLKSTSLFAEVDENVVPYGLLTHRHTGEMELALAHVAGAPVQVLFTPHLVPMTRGILATCYARPAVDGLGTDQLLARVPGFLRSRAVRGRDRRAARSPRRRWVRMLRT